MNSMLDAMNDSSIQIREIANDDSVSAITNLLHRAYASLAEQGFRYLATHQDEFVTRKRLDSGFAFVAELNDRIVGTVVLRSPAATTGCDWYDREGVSSFGQFGVEPDYQGMGIGGCLIETVEHRARKEGFSDLAIDTADGADKLIQMYQRRGYSLVGEADWDDTNYRSVILNKHL